MPSGQWRHPPPDMRNSFEKGDRLGNFFSAAYRVPPTCSTPLEKKDWATDERPEKKPFPVGDPPSLVAAEGNSRSDSHFSSDGLCGLFVISWWNFVLIRRTDRHVYHTLQGAYLSIYSVKTTILIRINCPCLCTYANQSDPHPRLQQNILLWGEFAK